MPKDSYQARSLFCPNKAFFKILFEPLDKDDLSSATHDDLPGLIESVGFFYKNFLGMLDGHASHCDPLHPDLDASQRAQQDPDFVQHQRRVTDTYPDCIDHRPPYIMPDLHGNALLFIY